MKNNEKDANHQDIQSSVVKVQGEVHCLIDANHMTCSLSKSPSVFIYSQTTQLQPSCSVGPIDKSISCKAAQKVTIPQSLWGLNGFYMVLH